MEPIGVGIHHQEVGTLAHKENLYSFNYTQNYRPISLIMPYQHASYVWHNRLHPIFDMSMPEGYLFELFKQHLMKRYGYLNDFLIFSHISPNIQSRLRFTTNTKQATFCSFERQEVLENDSLDTFNTIVRTFLDKNAISGVQPKSLALLRDKESLATKEYIIKTWGEEYPQLALNEYFCLQAMRRASLNTPTIMLSKNNHFLLVERFNYDKQSHTFLGFEEILTLLGKNKEEKYSGSYEQIAKVVYSVTTNKLQSMQQLYKIIVMNYLLKNGDAHLKNFGILYNDDCSQIWLAPAYDVVTTTVYNPKDRPALSMLGSKRWFGKKELLQFGTQHCYLTKHEANRLYSASIHALSLSIESLKAYLPTNKAFRPIGERMLDSWRLSLDEQTYKELPHAVIRNWANH
jgi:serine/threonine-protein kinase HipA